MKVFFLIYKINKNITVLVLVVKKYVEKHRNALYGAEMACSLECGKRKRVACKN